MYSTAESTVLVCFRLQRVCEVRFLFIFCIMYALNNVGKVQEKISALISRVDWTLSSF